MATKNNPGAFDCYAAAEPDEPMFVLLGRDPTAVAIVRLWAAMRVKLKLNEPGDPQITEALLLADEAAKFAGERGKAHKVYDAEELLENLRRALDASSIQLYDDAPTEAKYRKRQILRYESGPTALMRVSYVKDHGESWKNHSGRYHYYGRQFFGGTVGRYEFDCKPATPEEIAAYEAEEKKR